ncbi:hypothetical protein JV16_01914 [Anoxybacillus ayderensis]|uniref:Chloroquine resistance marker protein n=1 Tax=Anoxybacillus ayderensis TaxID=265546 RepID=A0A0D0HKU5_9BACL|nr:hypothetical protein C289_1032 [Anoxybacillus ayderensis]KIP20814.1 hypothetical protein JV16_01914 [Anoxybacillus ayderensis]NNU96670.1 chloroquine resistance marker protein [Anoxybacillus sp. EFIL]
MKRKFVLNITVLSLLLSFVYSFLLLMIEHSLFSNELSSPSNIVVFTAMFLILYVFHLFISWLYYMIANKMAGSMKRKIIVFYLFGLVLLLIVYVFFQVKIVWLLFLSFIILSFPSYKRG